MTVRNDFIKKCLFLSFSIAIFICFIKKQEQKDSLPLRSFSSCFLYSFLRLLSSAKFLTGAALKKDLAERMEDMSDFLKEQTEAVTEYTEPLVRRRIERGTIFDEKMIVHFKCGLEIEVAE